MSNEVDNKITSIRGLSYLCVIETTNTGFSAFVPDIPGVIATGSDKDQLFKNLSDALTVYLLDLSEIPYAATATYVDDEIEFETAYVVPTEPDRASLEIDFLMRSTGLKYSEVARLMGVPPSTVSRLTNPFYRGHGMDSLRKVAAALGREVEVSFKRVD